MELYACFLNREKGALGLLLEMNSFLGMGVVTYLAFFIYGNKADVPEEYKNLKSWINFQVIFLYISIVIGFLMYFCFRSMQSKVVLKKESAEHKQKAN